MKEIQIHTEDDLQMYKRAVLARRRMGIDRVTKPDPHANSADQVVDHQIKTEAQRAVFGRDRLHQTTPYISIRVSPTEGREVAAAAQRPTSVQHEEFNTDDLVWIGLGALGIVVGATGILVSTAVGSADQPTQISSQQFSPTPIISYQEQSGLEQFINEHHITLFDERLP